MVAAWKEGNPTSPFVHTSPHHLSPALTHTRCTVWLEGLLVIDNWEGVASGSTSSASPSLAKLSGCISIPAAAAPAVISVAFSGANLTAAKLQLSWSTAGCSGGGGSGPPAASTPPPPPLPPATAAAFSPLAGSVTTSTAWLPDAYTAGREFQSVRNNIIMYPASQPASYIKFGLSMLNGRHPDRLVGGCCATPCQPALPHATHPLVKIACNHCAPFYFLVPGQVGGLQCDVWRSATLPPAPVYQPLPLGATGSGAPTYRTRLSTGTWSFALNVGSREGGDPLHSMQGSRRGVCEGERAGSYGVRHTVATLKGVWMGQ